MNTPYDLRIWDQYHSRWSPLDPYESVEIHKADGWGIDRATIVVPGDHRLSRQFAYARTAPVPITFEMNGEYWSGQINNPVRGRDDNGRMIWTLHADSDHKHAHRMLALAPSAGVPTKKVAGNLATAMFDLVAQGAARTGLPVYILTETDGPGFEAEVRVEDTVAAVLDSFHDGANAFLDVRMLLPGQPIPGRGGVAKVLGPAEHAWMEAMRQAGHWPQAQPNPRLVGVGHVGDGVTPARAFDGVAELSVWGRPLDGPMEGVAWTPFEIRGEGTGGNYYPDGSSRVRPNTRVGAPVDLALAGKQKLWEINGTDYNYEDFGHHLTYWAADTWDWERERPMIERAATAGLLVLGNGETVNPDDLDMVERYRAESPVWAWNENGVWHLAEWNDLRAEIEKRAALGVDNAVQTPGVLFHLHEGRDRRHIVFSTSPNGGLDSWEASIKAPDGAALITGVQSDQWSISLGALTPRVERMPALEAANEDSPLAAGVDPERHTDVTVDVAPGDPVDGSSVSYGSVAGGVDISVAGPFFYRERYTSLSGDNVADAVRTLESAWADTQGGTTMQLTPSPRMRTVLGNDLVDDDGTIIPGWRIGDRVTFIDDGTQISEVISGWTFRHETGQHPVVEPVLGKRIHAYDPLGELVDTANRGVVAGDKAALAPPPKLPKWELEYIADGRVVNGTQDIRDALNGKLDDQFELIDNMKGVIDGFDDYVEDSLQRSESIQELADDVAGKVDGQSELIQQLEDPNIGYQALNTLLWGEQGRINTDNAQLWQEQGLANSLNNEMWGEQGRVNDLNERLWDTQHDVNEAVAAQLMLHENQLRWANQSARRVYYFDYWDMPRPGTTSEQHIYAVDLDTEHFYLAAYFMPSESRLGNWTYRERSHWGFIKPGWHGTIIFNQVAGHGQVDEPSPITIRSSGEQQQFTIPREYDYEVIVNPEWGPASREIILQAIDTPGHGFNPTDAYRQREQSLVTWNDFGQASFIFPVIANQPLIRQVGGSWLPAPSGEVINPGEVVNTTEESAGLLVSFTEILPSHSEPEPLRPDLAYGGYERPPKTPDVLLRHEYKFNSVSLFSGWMSRVVWDATSIVAGNYVELNISVEIANPTEWFEVEVYAGGRLLQSWRVNSPQSRFSTILTRLSLDPGDTVQLWVRSPSRATPTPTASGSVVVTVREGD